MYLTSVYVDVISFNKKFHLKIKLNNQTLISYLFGNQHYYLERLANEIEFFNIPT